MVFLFSLSALANIPNKVYSTVGDTMVSNVFNYGLDGKVFFCATNYPGSWGDGTLTSCFLVHMLNIIEIIKSVWKWIFHKVFQLGMLWWDQSIILQLNGCIMRVYMLGIIHIILSVKQMGNSWNAWFFPSL